MPAWRTSSIAALALCASAVLPGPALGVSSSDLAFAEFADCAGYEQPGDEPGLALTVCDPRQQWGTYLMGEADSSTATLVPAAGAVQTREPLTVSGLDRTSMPVIRPRHASSDLRVWAAVTPPKASSVDIVSDIPLAVLFPPVSVTPASRLRVDARAPGRWSLSDATGRVLATATPRDWATIVRTPHVRSARARLRGRQATVEVVLDRPYDGQALFFLVAGGSDVAARTHIAYGSRTGSITARVPKNARRARVVVYEKFESHGRAVSLSRP